MKLEDQYKHMMDQVRPERELRMADLEEKRNAPAAGRYFLVLVPAAVIVLLALLIPRSLFRGKTPAEQTVQTGNTGTMADTEEPEAEPAAPEIAVSADEAADHAAESPEEQAAIDPESQKEQAEAGPESQEEQAADIGGRSGGVIIAENKVQAVGNVRLYFEQMEKDLEENTVQAFIGKYPETGEAYRNYYDHLHSTNKFHVAEMVYIWLTPGHPEEEDGDYLLLGLRVKTDIQGPYDSLNDETHPNEGTDVSGWEFHGWSYMLNYLYHYDEIAGTLTPVDFPGQRLYLCRDFTFASQGLDTEWYTTDGRVLKNEEIEPYYDEYADITIPMDSYRQTQTESFFTINEDGEVVIEGQFTLMDIAINWATGDETDLLGREAQMEAGRAYDVLQEAHGKMQDILKEEEEFVSWKILDEPGD